MTVLNSLFCTLFVSCVLCCEFLFRVSVVHSYVCWLSLSPIAWPDCVALLTAGWLVGLRHTQCVHGMQPHACRKAAAAPTASAGVGRQAGEGVCLQCYMSAWTLAIQLLRQLLQELLRHEEHARLVDVGGSRELRGRTHVA